MTQKSKRIWMFALVQTVLSVLLIVLARWYQSMQPPHGSAVGSSFAIIGLHMADSVALPFVAGLVTWAILGRTRLYAPAAFFGLRYTLLALLGALLIWGLALSLSRIGKPFPDLILFMNVVVYGAPIVMVLAGALAARGSRRSASSDAILRAEP